MASAPVRPPELKFSVGTTHPALTLPSVTDGSNTFLAQQFVVNTSGALVKYAADGALLFGLSPDKSHVVTDEPYTAPYGEIHNVRALRGARFLMNLTDASGTVGSGTTTQATAVVGTSYSGIYLASPYTNILAIDVSGTGSNKAFKVESLWPEDASGDFNGRVIVSVNDSFIQ